MKTPKSTYTAVIIAVFSSSLCLAGTSALTIDPGTTHQTWHYTMCAGPNWNHSIPTASQWNTIQVQADNSLVSVVGCNTLSVNINSGAVETCVTPCSTPNSLGLADPFTAWVNGSITSGQYNTIHYKPVNDDSDPNTFQCDPTAGACTNYFSMGQPSFNIGNNFWAGTVAQANMIRARGETPHLIVNLSHWPSSDYYLDTSADTTGAEMGEFALAIVGYYASQGVTVDGWDVIVEPDNSHCNATQFALSPNYCQNAASGTWSSARAAVDVSAIRSRLSGAGYSTKLICCSTTSAANAVGWDHGSGADYYSTHLYGGFTYCNANPCPTNTNLTNLASQATTDGVLGTFMTEYDASGLSDVMVAMRDMNAIGYLKYDTINLAQYLGQGNPMTITTTTPYVTAWNPGTGDDDEPGWYLAQIWPYVREGAVRENCTAADNTLCVAWRRNGFDTVIERLTATSESQTVTVTGVAAGTYDCTYTLSASKIQVSCPTQTIGSGGTLSATISGLGSPTLGFITGAVTFFGVPNSANAASSGFSGTN